MPRKIYFSMLFAAVAIALVAFRPLVSTAPVTFSNPGSASVIQSAPDVTATALAPTAAPTAAVPDTTQSTAAVALIWAVIIIVVAITIFLVWRTRPGRRTG